MQQESLSSLKQLRTKARYQTNKSKSNSTMPQQSSSTKNGNEKTAFITPTDDDDRNHTNKTNRYKYMSVGAILVLGLVATGTSSSWVPSSLLRHGDTNEDTAKVLATYVEDNLIEEGSCRKVYKFCLGPGRGNCCQGLQCLGPFIGTCQDAPNCVGLETTCAGPGHGDCCDNLTCCSIVIPFIGNCVEHGNCMYI